jgi:hypothetical protein
MLGNFKLYAADRRCKHIFFAAANCPKYVQLLRDHGTKREKATLVSGFVRDSDIGKLGLGTVVFGDVFRAAPAISAGGYLESVSKGSGASNSTAVS